MKIIYEGKDTGVETWSSLTDDVLKLYQETYDKEVYIEDGNLHIKERRSYEVWHFKGRSHHKWNHNVNHSCVCNYMISPCKVCEGREIGCHSNCDKYKEFRDLIDKKNEAFKEGQEMSSYISSRRYYETKKYHTSQANKYLYR